MIAPACYPVNGAEAIVNMKLLQAFARAEDVTVDLISRNNTYTYPSDSLESYGVRINELFLIESVPHMDIPTFWKMLLSLIHFHYASFDSVWAVSVLPIVKKLIRKNHYDFILTKNAPSYLLGAYLKRKGLNWVASWNDPFPSGFYPYPYGNGKDWVGTRKDHKVIKQMRKASFHVFPTYLLQEHMRTFLQIPEDRCKVIPHVVLKEKNTMNSLQRKADLMNDTLSIIHSGNLYGHRNPLTFFSAVNNVLVANPSYKISVTILGKMDDKFKHELGKMSKLKKCLTFLPPVEYQKSLSLLEDYDVACVIEAPCRKGEAVFLPTKVTDFMQMGIPVLAISPNDGVLHQLYRNGNIGYYGDVSNTAAIEDEIIKMYRDFTANGLKNNIIGDSFYADSVVESYREIARNMITDEEK